jgi:hypothetical protein
VSNINFEESKMNIRELTESEEFVLVFLPREEMESIIKEKIGDDDLLEFLEDEYGNILDQYHGFVGDDC